MMIDDFPDGVSCLSVPVSFVTQNTLKTRTKILNNNINIPNLITACQDCPKSFA